MKNLNKSEQIVIEIYPLINEISERLKKMDRYCVHYTHSYEQGNEKNQNILVIPKDDRFDRFEFIGMLLDMLRDYADSTGWDLKGSLEIKVLSEILAKLEKGEKV